MRSFIFVLMLIIHTVHLHAQQGIIRGQVKDAVSNEAIVLATIRIQQNTTGTRTDTNGRFELKALNPGLYNLEISYVGYRKKTVYEIAVDNSKPTLIDIPLEKEASGIREVSIREKVRKDKTEESPLSLKNIGVNEIQRNPGGGRDISKVIQSLPGVGSSVGYRNDLIIRGGGPSENRFYLDGMEIPNLNHFATQGANGGPVGILNVDFLQDVGYYSAAFPANRGNLLSGLLDFKMKNPRSDGWHGAFTLGSSDIGLRAEGPLNAKSGLMVSVRRSYLKFLFTALDLPFLPTYNDVQVKYKVSLNPKNELTYLLLGAYDNAVLNTQSNKTESQKYILGVLPEQKQWNYTNGIVYKHYKKNSFQTLVLSRNMFDNYSFKYRNNDANQPVTLKYQSQEIENKFRAENTIRSGAWKLNYGVGAEYVKYNNNTYNVLTIPGGVIDTIQYQSEIDFIKYAAFGQVSRSLLRDALTLSLGIRADGNTYSSSMKNLLKQLSPRFSASYKMTERLFVNLNSGLYYQLPAYTTLGFKNADNVYINKLNQLKYIQCAQAVGGLEYSLPTNLRFSIEGFYKKYSQYPQSVSRGLSLANTGGDFGVVGNESVSSVSSGRSYGLELFMQQKLYKGMYGLLAVTLFRSEFTNANTGTYSPSNWDQRFIVNATLGKKIKRGWEIGGKFRFTGGRPFTPYDTVLSSVSAIWDVAQSGQINYQRANENRLPVNHQLDIRIDKKYFFKHWNLNFFLDVQNVYGFVAKEQDILTVKRDSNGNPLPDLNSGTPARYQMQFLSNGSGTVLPTIGIIVEY